jgi:hypothetical protein
LRAFVERFRTRSDVREAMIEASNARLLDLRSDGDSVAPSHNGNGHRASHEPAQRAALLPEGPIDIELSEHEGQEFLLGDHDDPACIQVWRQGGRYLLQHVSGPPVSVGGELLTSPIVVLDDGDEIACGDERVRVRFAPAPVETVAD